MIITPNKFALMIENAVKNKKMSYMDAIIEYCNSNGIDPSNAKGLINKKRFLTPKNYFDNIILKKIDYKELITKRFKTPDNYFESIDKQQIFNLIYINKLKFIKKNVLRIVSMAAMFGGLVYFSNYYNNKEFSINSVDVINYVNEDYMVIDDSEYLEMLDFNKFDYYNLISEADIENYFIESSFNIEYLIFE